MRARECLSHIPDLTCLDKPFPWLTKHLAFILIQCLTISLYLFFLFFRPCNTRESTYYAINYGYTSKSLFSPLSSSPFPFSLPYCIPINQNIGSQEPQKRFKDHMQIQRRCTSLTSMHILFSLTHVQKYKMFTYMWYTFISGLFDWCSCFCWRRLFIQWRYTFHYSLLHFLIWINMWWFFLNIECDAYLLTGKYSDGESPSDEWFKQGKIVSQTESSHVFLTIHIAISHFFHLLSLSNLFWVFGYLGESISCFWFQREGKRPDIWTSYGCRVSGHIGYFQVMRI